VIKEDGIILALRSSLRRFEMDPTTLTQVWVDLATNAPFLGFLLYQWYIQRRDVQEYKEEIQLLRKEAKEEEKTLRARFEKVISDLNDDRDQIVSGLEKRISAIEAKLETIEKSVRKLFAILEPIRKDSEEARLQKQIKKMAAGIE
tara:strand:+ start:368 stop:805 length:438 start_codon:yes stop_codon:yes gene_type:complete